MHDGVSGLAEKKIFQLRKMSRQKDGKSLLHEISNKILESNSKCDPKDFLKISTRLLSIHGKNGLTIFSPNSIEDLLFFLYINVFQTTMRKVGS